MHHRSLAWMLFPCTTRSQHPPCKRTTQGKWEIYLLIVISRIVKSTYPVMFVMIFDSISIEGILKKCIKSLHSCWNEMERSRCRRNDENLMLDALRTPLSLSSLFVNLYFMRVFIRSCEIATFQWFPVFILSLSFSLDLFRVRSSFFRCLLVPVIFVSFSSSIQIPFRVYWISLWSRAACMCNVILLFCSRLLRITFVSSCIETNRHYPPLCMCVRYRSSCMLAKNMSFCK